MKSSAHSHLLVALVVLGASLLMACGGDKGGAKPDAGLGDGSVIGQPGMATPLDRTVTSDFASGFRFLYDGPNATQTGVAAGAIDPRRMAVVRGRVLDGNAQPLAGVAVAVVREPALGSTKTQVDGTFDLVVNGGGPVVVSFDAAEHLPVQRTLTPVWNTFERAPDVFLTKRDAKVTMVSLGASALQVASGSTVKDRSGERTGTLLFPAGTSAEIVLPDGSKKPLKTAHVRVTEYTAGDIGPKAMPATLPPQSGYTYAVELSVDEAESAGAREVSFSKPVPYYVENFLNFPVGEPVPAGFLDRQGGDWIAAESGRVIKVLAIDAGSARIDSNGDGNADSPEMLAALGVDAEELKTLAAKYAAGNTLWRIPLKHFSAWDFNWCFFGEFFDAVAGLFDGRPLGDSCIASGSVIECENQILGESLGIVGLPYELHYRSDRVPGRRDAYHFEVQLVGDKAPPGAKRVKLELDVLGQHRTHMAEATPKQMYSFDWDGRDAYGRVWQGPATVRYRVGYVFDGWYSHTPVFGAYGEVDRTRWERAPDNQFPRPAGITAEDDLARLETTMWLPWQSSVLGTFDASALGFGGFTLGIHHTYDPASQTLYLGTGDRRQATPDTRAVRALLGAVGGQGDASGQGRRTKIDQPHGLAVAPDGTIYVSLEAQNKVVRVTKDGKAEVVAGTGTAGYSGDGGPATKATLDKPLGLALARDGTLYIAERENHVVRRVRPDGTIETFAGGGKMVDDGAPKPAREAQLGEAHAVAMGLDGSLFIVDSERNNVRRVRTDGIIETVLGSASGAGGDSGDGGPGSKALLRNPLSVAVGPDGSAYVAEFRGHRIRRLTPDGSVMTVAGTGKPGYSGDGAQATLAQLNQPHTVDVGADGTLYIADEANSVLRSVSADGVIRTVAGGGQTQAADFTPALDAKFDLPRLTVVEPNGNLLVADYDGDFVYRVLPFLPTAAPDGITIASEEGTVYYQFDGTGRHLKTVDAYTHKAVWSFVYDPQGRLTAVRDVVGRMMTIERDANGRAARLVSPDGLASTLSYGDQGWLTSVTNPAGEPLKLALSESGLLLSQTDAAGRVHSFAYDANGRLSKDTETTGSFQTLERSADKLTVVRKNALGHATSYLRDPANNKLTVTGPDGLKAVRTKSRASTTVLMPDGSSTTVQLKADPRFGMQAAYAGVTTVKLPSGASTDVKHTRTLTYSKPDDPTSLSIQTDRVITPAIGEVQTVHDVGKRTRTTTSQGDTSTTTFDELGRVVQIAPTGGLSPISYAYDENGRLIEVTQGTRKAKYRYDERGFVSEVIDAAGVAHRFQRDAVGRALSYTTAQQPVASLLYAPGGNLTSVTTPTLREHKFAYDLGGRTNSYEAPSLMPGQSTKVEYTYEADDALKSVTAASGKRVETQHDAAGRLAGIVTPEGAIKYKYDEKTGTLASASYGEEALSFAWDGPVPLSITSTGTVKQRVSMKYDASLRPSEENVAGSAVRYTYDPQGRIASIGAETLTYRDAQRISKRTIGIVTSSYEYSAEYGELRAQEAKAGDQSLYSIALTRDALGRIVTQQETIQGEASTTAYGYDALGRLVSVETSERPSRSFSYDANGNRTDANAVYDAQDRLIRFGDISYEYTTDGDLLRRTDTTGSREYTYDSRGQLTKVTVAGKTISYVIDALGRRIAKKVDGATVQAFVYDLAGRLVAELDPTGAVARRFVYGSRPHVPDYIIQGTTTLKIVSDSRGSPRLVIDTTNGSVVQRIDYDEWGSVIRDTSPGTQPFRFAGGLWDIDTQLIRFGARDYDPQIGRWTAKDPIRFEGGDTNLFSYVGNDPVNLIDPFGTDAWSAAEAFVEGAVWAIGGGVVVGAALASGTVVGGLIAVGIISYGAYSFAVSLATVVNGRDMDGNPLSVEQRVDVAAGMAGAMCGGAALGGAAARGYTWEAARYPNAGGGGFNVLRNGERVFGADWHRFGLDGKMVNRPHLHYGETKGQMKKHRPWQKPGGGGWRLPWD